MWGYHGGSEGKESACNAGDVGLIPGLGRSLEKEMANHYSILAWGILGQSQTQLNEYTGTTTSTANV